MAGMAAQGGRVDGQREVGRGDEALRDQIAGVLAPVGLRLSEEKTLITHIDGGLDFLGWRIQRHRKRGTSRQYVYVYPSTKAVKAVKARVKTLCRQVAVNQPLDDLLHRIGMALRGWCGYFRHGCHRPSLPCSRSRGGIPEHAWPAGPKDPRSADSDVITAHVRGELRGDGRVPGQVRQALMTVITERRGSHWKIVAAHDTDVLAAPG
jgi:hypothetical protein